MAIVDDTTKNSTEARGRRVLNSLSDERRAFADKAYDMAVEADDYDPSGFVAKGLVESNFNPNAVNKGGYTGLYQIDTRGGKTGNGIVLDDLVEAGLMTAPEAKRINLKNPQDNMKTALLYRKRLYDMLGDRTAADIGYNAGPTILREAMKVAKSNSAPDLARAMAKVRPKSIYGTAKKIKEISEYQPAIAALVPDVNKYRQGRGLPVPGAAPLQGQAPGYAGGQSGLPGQGIAPPGVAPQAGVPQPPVSDPLTGAQQLYGQVGIEGATPPASPQDQLYGPAGIGQEPQFGNVNPSIPLPTESPDLRNALSELTGGGLSYNIPLGGQFDRQARKEPLSQLDTFLDTLLDRA